MNLRDRIDAAPMSRYQWMIIGLCVLLNCLDGFDVMTMAFTANGVSKEFDLSGTELGVLLSAGLVGMAVGSLFLAPFADVIGRRPTVLACVGMAGTGMLLGAISPTALTLGGARVLTGLGVGGILACTNVIASEYSNSRRRGLAIGIYSAGYGLGATLGGLAAVGLQAEFGWRAVFVVGAVATFTRPGPAAPCCCPSRWTSCCTAAVPTWSERLNKILVRVGQPQITSAERGARAARPRRRTLDGRSPPGRQPAAPALRRSTVLVWLAFFATMFGFYFVNTWTPKLLVESGLSDQQAVTAGLMIALGGTVGAVGYGVVATRGDNRRVLMLLHACSPPPRWWCSSSAPRCSPSRSPSASSSAPSSTGASPASTRSRRALYDPRIRSTGMGWGIGLGRIGAILAPLATGALVDASWSPGAAVRRRRGRRARGPRRAVADARPRAGHGRGARAGLTGGQQPSLPVSRE